VLKYNPVITEMARNFIVKLIDEKFKKHKARYMLQCGLTTVCVLILLLLMDVISDRVIVASLGASSFIAFTMPHAHTSSPRFLIAGYVIGILSAWICSSLFYLLVGNQQFIAFHISCHIFFGALAVGLSVFLMVVTNSEHPPAAALALGLVMDGCPPVSIVVSLTGIIPYVCSTRL